MNIPARIDRFIGEWGFLSNFSPVVLIYEGQKYASVEHAYQAAKTLDMAKREVFTLDFNPRLTAGQAKRMGRKIKPFRSDWDEVKNQVMYDLLLQKFSQPALRTQLLATLNAELVEGNTWDDQYWGVCMGCEYPHEPSGLNWLGRLLMEVRNVISTQPPTSSLVPMPESQPSEQL